MTVDNVMLGVTLHAKLFSSFVGLQLRFLKLQSLHLMRSIDMSDKGGLCFPQKNSFLNKYGTTNILHGTIFFCLLQHWQNPPNTLKTPRIIVIVEEEEPNIINTTATYSRRQRFWHPIPNISFKKTC